MTLVRTSVDAIKQVYAVEPEGREILTATVGLPGYALIADANPPVRLVQHNVVSMGGCLS